MSGRAFSSQAGHPKEPILLLVHMQALFPFSPSQFEGTVSVKPSDGNKDSIRRRVFTKAQLL